MPVWIFQTSESGWRIYSCMNRRATGITIAMRPANKVFRSITLPLFRADFICPTYEFLLGQAHALISVIMKFATSEPVHSNDQLPRTRMTAANSALTFCRGQCQWGQSRFSKRLACRSDGHQRTLLEKAYEKG